MCITNHHSDTIVSPLEQMRSIVLGNGGPLGSSAPSHIHASASADASLSAMPPANPSAPSNPLPRDSGHLSTDMTMLQLEPANPENDTPGLPNTQLDGNPHSEAYTDDLIRLTGSEESNRRDALATPMEDQASVPDLIDTMPTWLHPLVKGLQVDSSLAVANLLSAISSIAGKGLVLVDGSRRTYPNLFITYGCPPAFGKSIVQDQVFAPVNRIETEQRDRLRSVVSVSLLAKIHEISYEIAKIRKTFSQLDEDGVRDACEEIAGLDLEVLDIKTKLARTGIFLINDATPAGLKKDLATTPNHYVAMILSDGRELLSRLSEDHYKTQAGSLCQILLNAYSGDRLTISRATGTRHHVIDAPRMTLLALAQTDILCKFFAFEANHQSGLASRLLFFESLSSGMRPGNLSPRMQEEWADQVGQIHSMVSECPPTENEETPDAPARPVEIHFSENARSMVAKSETTFSRLAREAEDRRQEVMWDRAGEQLRRLALCRAMLRKDFHISRQVNRDDVKAARLILKYSITTFLHLCDRTSNAATLPQEVLDLQNLVKKAGGSLELNSIVDGSLSSRKARMIARSNPKVFSLKNARTGRVGKPRKIICLKEAVLTCFHPSTVTELEKNALEANGK